MRFNKKDDLPWLKNQYEKVGQLLVVGQLNLQLQSWHQGWPLFNDLDARDRTWLPLGFPFAWLPIVKAERLDDVDLVMRQSTILSPSNVSYLKPQHPIIVKPVQFPFKII